MGGLPGGPAALWHFFRPQRPHDSDQPDPNRLYAARNDYQVSPIEDREAAEAYLGIAPPQQPQRNPGARVQDDHSPGLGHPAAEFPLDADRLAQRSDIGDKEGEDGGPVTAGRMAPSAVAGADE